MKQKVISCILLITFLFLSLSACHSQKLPPCEPSEETKNGITHKVFPIDEQDEGKEIIQIGVLLHSEFFVSDGPFSENRIAEINQYLREADKPYRIQIHAFTYPIVLGVGASPEQLAESLSQASEETLDLLIGCVNPEQLSSCCLDLSQELRDGRLQTVGASLPPAYWKRYSQNGQIFNLDNYPHFTPRDTISFNLPRLDELNIDVPDTASLEQLDSLLRSIEPVQPLLSTRFNSQNTPVMPALNWLNPYPLYQMIAPAIGISQQTGKVEFVLTNELLTQKIDFLQSWHEEGFLVTEDKLPFTSTFYYSSPRFPISQKTNEPLDLASDGSWQAFDQIALTISAPIYWLPDQDYAPCTSIPKTCRDTDIVMSFLEDLAQDTDLYNHICQHHQLFCWFALDDDSDGSYERPLEGNSWQKDFYQLCEQALYYKDDGFVLDTASIQDKIDVVSSIMLSSGIDQTVANNTFDYSTISADVQTLIHDLEEAGINDIIAEAERQLADWRAGQ